MSRPKTWIDWRAGGTPGGTAPSVIAALLLATLLLAGGAAGGDASALTSATITVDGDLSDWYAVLADPGNVQIDSMVPADPDAVGQPDRDIENVAVTYDDENLYFYFRRSATGTREIALYAYIDRDGDEVLETGDMVAIFDYLNSGYQTNPNSSNVVYYTPSSPSGDPLTGDGATEPGTARPDVNRVAGAAFLGARDPEGVRFEMRVSWATLGLPPGSPVRIHFASGNGTHAPGHIEDNVGDPEAFALLDRGATFQPDRTIGTGPGEPAVFIHTLRNDGNTADVFTLEASSSPGWSTEMLVNGVSTDTVLLAPGETAVVTVTVTSPSGTKQGKTCRTVVTARSGQGVEAAVVDTSVVGVVTVTPNGSSPIAAGEAVEYAHTVANHFGAPLRVDLSALSSLGWDVRVHDAAGSEVTSLVLAAGASREVYVTVTAPAGASPGQQDVTTLTAAVEGDPEVFGAARSTSVVRAPLVIAPDSETAGGPGAGVLFRHTVTNNTASPQDVTLSALSSLGWVVDFLDLDGVTPLTGFTLDPSGGSRDVYARVTIPAGATSADLDVTTVTASAGSFSDTATDRTQVQTLVTYDTPGYQTAEDAFALGDTVFARAMGLGSYSGVRFRWLDSSGAEVRMSPVVSVDDHDSAPDTYRIPTAAALGTWTIIALDDKKGVEVSRTTFTVGHQATITGLAATDAPGVGDQVAVVCSVRNDSGLAIAGSSLSYLIWWDGDGDGVFGAGDLYIDASGASQVYDGTGLPQSHLTGGIDVAAGATWQEPAPWTVSNAGFPNQGTYHLTAVWRDAGGTVIDEAVTEFFSVPTLGWALFGALTLGGAWLAWRRRPGFPRRGRA